MKKIGSIIVIWAIAIVGMAFGAASPAAAHGSWPGNTSTGYGIYPYPSTLGSPIGDQIFTSSCGSPPCLHVLDDEHIQGKVVAGSGHFVAIVNSHIEHDNDAIAIETTGTGSIQLSWSTISGPFENAAVGRNIQIDHADISGITRTGVVLGARGHLEYSWLHDFDLDTNYGYPVFGVHVFDVWQYCQLVNIPDGCNNPGGSSGFITGVTGNLIQLDGNVWSALWAVPAFGTNPTGAQWQINDNFFVGGASETVHIEDPNGDLQWLATSRNHVISPDNGQTVANYDVACGWEDDTYSTATPQNGGTGIGASC